MLGCELKNGILDRFEMIIANLVYAVDGSSTQ